VKGAFPAESIEQRLQRLEVQLQGLSEALNLLTARLSALEVKGLEAPADLGYDEVAAPELTPDRAQGTVLNLLTQVGRSCLVLGGAFLVRSLTDTGVFARPVGVTLGLAYAVLWILLADRSAGRGRRSSAAFLGITAVVIAYPLVVETTTRWPVFSPAGAAATLTALTGLCFAVAWRHNLALLAWAAAGGAAMTAFALSLITGAVEPFAAGLLVAGLAGVWFGYGAHHWLALRWPLAAAADILVLWAALRLIPSDIAAPESGPPISFFLLLAFALPFLYTGSFALFTLARRRDVTIFEVVQTVASLAIGLGGAAAVASHVQDAQPTLGASALLIGAGCYAIAFVFVERQQGRGRNFIFYATLALLLTVAGSALMPRGFPLGVFWCVLALVSAFLATRLGRVTLGIHSAAYAFAAAWQTGLLQASTDAFVAPPATAFAPVTAAGMATIATAAVCYVLLAREREDAMRKGVLAPRVVLVVLVAAGLGALVIDWLRGWTDGKPPGSDPGAVAALRTGVLAAAALLFAGARRRTGLPELTGLAYAILLLATGKLLFEDLPRGRASTLFVGFAFYGIALLVTPRLLRGGEVRSSESS
jgi:hypothetical protein